MKPSNPKTDFKFLMILLLLVLTCSVAWSQYFSVYKKTDSVSIHLFPKTLGEWVSQELTITEREYAILETRNAFVRKYQHPSGTEIFLFIVYSDGNRRVSHPPEICYVGGGVSIMDNQNEMITVPPLPPIKTNKLVLEQGDTQQIAFYWFKIGDTYTSNYWKQQSLMALKTLLGQKTGSALIRLSTTVQNNDTAEAERDIKKFAQLIVPQFSTYLP